VIFYANKMLVEKNKAALIIIIIKWLSLISLLEIENKKQIQKVVKLIDYIVYVDYLTKIWPFLVDTQWKNETFNFKTQI
jgi:hypothetical protein